MARFTVVLALLAAALATGCMAPSVADTFGNDLTFLKKHVEVAVLTDAAGQAQVAVVPALQGRVMTSTAAGSAGISFGWINRELMDSGKRSEHFNPFGGEERFWMGPEGGQFSIFFAKGDPFDLDHWYTPPSVDTQPWEVVAKTDNTISFRHLAKLTNYSGTVFDVRIERTVNLLDPATVWKHLGVTARPGVRMVAYESINRITNTGPQAWKKETGLLSVWILSMFTPSPATTIVVPIRPGPEASLGKAVNDDYFGKVPTERLVVKDQVAFFSADGKCRSKIGVSPRRARPVLGSYDAANHVLTLAQFTLPDDVTDYVNSQWKLQDDPYGGDAANCYNDGPPAPGAKPMGPFFELESSSPAAALAPGQTLGHVHRTIHLQGNEADLDAVSRAVLGVSLAEITKAFAK